MGEVYRAKDSRLGREAAIKVLPATLATNEDALARFEVEARALAALSHPNILGIFEFGSEDGISYVVMELLEGETLRDKLKEGAPLPQRKALEYTREIARGLSAAHAKGIVHRDLKPENVFITNDDRVKILDFGLAKRTGPSEADRDTHSPTAAPPSPTTPGSVMGTVGYMAPEQVRGLPVDQRADIFALGAMLYELLTGKRAFKGLTPSDTMLSVLRDEPPELSQTPSAIPPALTRLLRHCLEKSPDARRSEGALCRWPPGWRSRSWWSAPPP
jgi:serine/threonine protein kinase